MIRVRVCRCALLCAGTPHVYFRFVTFLVCSSFLLLPLPYHVCITPCLKFSRSLLCGSHGTTVAQHVCVYHYLLCVCWHSICVCCVCYDMCACVGVRICVLEPTFKYFRFVAFLVSSLFTAAATVSLYHTVPQVLELSTLWQSRFNSRTASLCGPPPCVCGRCIRVCDVCVLCYVNMWHVLLLLYCSKYIIPGGRTRTQQEFLLSSC